jgi:hypothetical protein
MSEFDVTRRQDTTTQARSPQATALLDAQNQAAVGQSQEVNPHQTDPRLARNDQTFKGGMTGREMHVDPEAKDGSKLPWTQGGNWDHSQILSLWSQIDGNDSTITDEVRCAANAALAPRIVQGAESVINFATELLVKAEQVAQKPNIPDAYRDRLYLMRMPLSFAIASLRSSHYYHKTVEPAGPIGPDPLLGFRDPMPAYFADPASFSDLSTIAEATKRLVSVNEEGLSNAQEAANMHGINADGSAGIGEQIESRKEMDAFVNKLVPGQAYMVLVDTGRGTPDKSHVHQKEESDHFITLGREPQDKGGRLYLYDPYPRTGSQIIYLDGSDKEALFWPYFEVDPAQAGGQDVFKRTHIVSVATAR